MCANEVLIFGSIGQLCIGWTAQTRGVQIAFGLRRLGKVQSFENISYKAYLKGPNKGNNRKYVNLQDP